MAISINTNELTEILELTPSTQNILLVGKHGIGKSEILKTFFEQKNIPVVLLFLGQMSDPGDLIGLPTKNEQTGKTDFMPPFWFPTDNKPVVLFLDELNRARPEVLQTIMDLALNRKLAGKKLPAGSRVISAINDGDEYQLTDLDPALVSRFNVYVFKPTVQEWLLWAEKQHLDTRVITFIQENPQWLDGSGTDEDSGLEKTPDRRAWKKVSDIIQRIEKLQTKHKKMISGIVGLQATAHFFEFFSQEKILTAREVLLSFNKHKTELLTYELHQIALVNDAIFRFLETEEGESEKEAVCNGLESYIELFKVHKKNEAFAHFVSLFEKGGYKNAAVFILTQTPTLYDSITTFIKSL